MSSLPLDFFSCLSVSWGPNSNSFLQNKIKLKDEVLSKSFTIQKCGFGRNTKFRGIVRSVIRPCYPIIEEHDVFRKPGDPDSFVILEGDGTLKVQVKFSIADRKALKVRTKSRIFSSLYKVETSSFKEVLNQGMAGALKSPISGDVEHVIGEVTQEISGIFNNEKITIEISSKELGNNFSTQGDVFIKYVVYKFFEAYKQILAKQAQAVGTSPTPAATAAIPVTTTPQSSTTSAPALPAAGQTSGSTPTGVASTQGSSTGAPAAAATGQTSSTITNLFAELNSVNVGLDFSRPDGLKNIYLEKPMNQLFLTGFSTTSSTIQDTLPSAGDPKKRTLKSKKTTVQSLPQTVIADTFFNGFSTLPVSLRLLQADVPTVSNFTIEAGELATVKSSPNCLLHSLVIDSRQTNYEVFLSTQNPLTTEPVMLYSYFEDGVSYERCYVKPDFLGAAIHKVLLQHIEQLHCPRVVYISARFESFEKKLWVNGGTKCKKEPYNKFDVIEVPYVINHCGKNLLENVNYSANLLFTANFEENSPTFFKTNRFVTCSAFMDQKDVASASNKALFTTLEKAFAESILISDAPMVKLIPAFERGMTIELSDTVFFRGLSSNASSAP
uniref:Uncharacterized protein n=1 Tax=Pediastrum duplex TaxID=3105 RepID=A0A2U8GIJ7_PEDDU|nr:hypothetical protein [Pediastrum duplex]